MFVRNAGSLLADHYAGRGNPGGTLRQMENEWRGPKYAMVSPQWREGPTPRYPENDRPWRKTL